MQKYISKLNLEKKKSNFFSSTNETSIAIDDSGSTEGEIMETQKEILTSILSNTNCKQLLNNILCWDNICTINPINRIQSGGLTEPSCIFKKLDKNVKNLLITTDGEIKDEEVNKTRDIINNFKNLKNIICILFQDEEKSPCELNIAVFYPFLEHAKKMQGVFYLFYYKSHNVYLLMKNTPQFFNDNKMFKDPPLQYDETIKWEDIPKYKYNEINKIEVISEETNDGTLFMPKNNQILYLKSLEKEILEEKKSNDYSLVNSKDFNIFMKENINILIEECIKSFNSENFNSLRNIVSEWKRGLLNNIGDIDNKKIELYNRLMNKKLEMKDTKSQEYNDLKNQLLSLSKEINGEIQQQKATKAKKEHDIQELINSIMERITEEQNNILNAELSNDYTLKNITKISNRVKRASKLKIIENSDDWDLTGNPIICDECLICSREDQPMALLMIDISVENTKLFEENVSDFSLNDEINTGTRNVCAIPSGEFCVECAYTMWGLGKHPLSRQKIGSILVLGDPTIKTNNKKYLNAVCCSIFGGREINASLQLLLGLFDELEKNEKINKSENRFSPKVYDWIHKLILFNINGNLLTENFGTNKQFIKAMYDVINYKFSPFNEETWFIPLRNKTINSMSIIARCVMNEISSVEKINENELKKKCIIIMRRLIIKIILTKVINICKNKIKGKQDDIKLYHKMCFLIENDLFNNNITCVPIINSEKICCFEKSKMIQVLFNGNNKGKDELKEMMKSIEYFEMFINNKYKEGKDFKLFTENIITLITLGIYILINDKKDINNLCISDEDALKGFLGVIDIKKSYTEQEKKIIELNKEIFLYGDTKEISSLSEEQLKKIIKSISYYSKIKQTDDKHFYAICKYASHLFSPCVTQCSVCGISFITEEEKQSLQFNKNTKIEIANIKERKYNHIKKYCYTTNYGGFDEFSNIFPLHKIVRTVCCMEKYSDLERPTRKLILEELKMLKNMNRKIRGNIYVDILIKCLVSVSWDFLQRRKNLSKERQELLKKDVMTIQERILIEINEPQDNYIGVETNMDGLTEEEISKLTKGFVLK